MKRRRIKWFNVLVLIMMVGSFIFLLRDLVILIMHPLASLTYWGVITDLIAATIGGICFEYVSDELQDE